VVLSALIRRLWLRRGVVLFRCPVHVRDAAPSDVPQLGALLGPATARGGDDAGPSDAESAVAAIALDPDQRLIVAETDGQVVGVAHLVRAPVSPLQRETAVHVLHLNVLDELRRHGVGHALMEATVTWAEEKDSTHVLAAASANSRDANRFMARLGLAQVAIVRGATVSTLRAKLPVEPPAAARVGSRSHRSVGQVLAQRRSQRRAQTKSP
jgi:N-acetylglutamate synthase-like GNAT family acetyltransferase